MVTLTSAAVTAKGIDSYSPGSHMGTIGLVMVLSGLALVVTGLASPSRDAAPSPSRMIRRR